MNEIWKDIKGYEGSYQVSNLGRVKSLNYHREGIEKILKIDGSTQYKTVMLYRDGGGTRFLLHRLVASAFIPNPNNYPVVNHIDEDKSNNRVDNLEWCTQQYNVNYGTGLDRLSKVLKGKKRSEEAKKRISEINKGRVQSLESRMKRSKSLKGRSSWNKGKKRSEETKLKISSTMKKLKSKK